MGLLGSLVLQISVLPLHLLETASHLPLELLGTNSPQRVKNGNQIIYFKIFKKQIQIFFNYVKLRPLKVKLCTKSIFLRKVLERHYFSPKRTYCTFLKAISLD